MRRRRRRRLLRTIGVAACIIVGVAVAVIFGDTARHSTQAAALRPRRHRHASPSSSSTASASSESVSVFAKPAIAAYLDQQPGDVTAALYDLNTGQISMYRPGVALEMASIQKVNILEAMLYQAQQQNVMLSPDQLQDATEMVEASDDDDATELWVTDGGATGVGDYDSLVGLTGTTLNTEGYWGLSTTTAADQIRLLQELVAPNSLLSPASRAFTLNLMENVDSDQDWGVSAGVPAGVTVALKDGWDPTNGSWEINSIGYVDGDGRDYLIAVLTGSNPSMASCISTIQGLSQLVWQELASAHDN